MSIDHRNFRLRGIPSEYHRRANVRELVRCTLSIPSGTSFAVHSLATSPVDGGKVATLSFDILPDGLSDTSRNEWVFSLPVDDDLDYSGPGGFLVFDTHFFGFTPLQHAKDNDCYVDVIAISGLGGHAFGSFKERHGPFMWLRDALPLDVPRARVLIYGYDTRLEQSISIQNLTDLGRAFRIDMKSVRRYNPCCPIIFIGHSLGGLVIKEAIVKMAEARDDKDISILTSVSGFLFFGVPHYGTAIESLVPLVCNNPNRNLLESLGKNSALLERLGNEFSNAFQTRQPPVTAFYETESSPTAEKKGDKWMLSGPPQVLVDMLSATHGSENRCPINRNHSDMVKLKHKNDEVYVRVRITLESLISRQDTLVTKAMDCGTSVRAPLSEEQKDCLRSLGFREQEHRYHDIYSAKNTCEWLFEDAQYQAWLNQPRGLFWIKGNPGVGKSVLMKFAVKMNPGEHGGLVAFFFCHGRGTLLQKTPLGVFRALLNSILEYFPKHFSSLTAKFQNREAHFGSYKEHRWDWTEGELQEAISDVLIQGTRGRPVTIFIDALDECGEDYAKYLLEFFKQLMDDVKCEEGRVKICVSSRHYPILNLLTIPAISVEEKNDKDIRLVIRERLKEINPEEKRQRIEKQILLKAQGGFQWVVLVIEMVIEESTIGIKPDKIYKKLTTTPETLEELYTNILSGVSDAENRELVNLFHWILFPERPLSTQELREALATNKNITCTTISELRSQVHWADTAGEFETYVKHISRGLVEFRTREVWEQYEPGGENWDREAQFIHQSVADYVLGKCLYRGTHCPYPTLSRIGAGHFEISRSCLNYVTLKEVSEDATHLSRGRLSARYPLAPYAVHFLFYHILEVEREGIPQHDLLALFQGEKWLQAVRAIACLWRVLDPDSTHTPMGWPFINATPMHAIVACGSKSAFDKYLESDDVQVDGRDLNGNTPLLLATRECHEEMAIILLSRSIEWQARCQEATNRNITQSEDAGQQKSYLVDVNAENEDGDTPLTIALTGNAQAIIFKLIEAGADLTCVGKGIGLVFCAIHNRNRRLLKTLIEKQVKLDGAVYFAVSELSILQRELVLEEMISELLKAGANTSKLLECGNYNRPHWDEVDGWDDGGSYDGSDWDENEHDDDAILLASQKGQMAITDLLLSHGASTTSKDRHGTYPLLAAVENGHGELTELLLRTDPAAVRLKDNHGRTALDAALANGEFEMAMLLLREGSFSVPGITFADAFIRAMKIGQLETVKAILREDSCAKLFVDDQGTMALLSALEADNEELALLLITEGHALNIDGNDIHLDDRDNITRSPLSWASEKGHDAVVRLLVGRGVNIESKDGYGITPLSWAARTGHQSIVNLLLENGADVMSRDGNGQTPLWWASVGGHESIIKMLRENCPDLEDSDGQEILRLAANDGHGAVVELPQDEVPEVKICFHENQPSVWADKDVLKAIIPLLHKRGRFIEPKNQDGQIPLSWAPKMGHETTIKLLFEIDSDIDLDNFIDPRYKSGQKLLVHAAIEGYAGVTSILLGFKEKVTIEPLEGATTSHNGKELTALLLDRREDDITMTKMMVKGAAGNYHNSKEVMALLLDSWGDKIIVTEKVAETAAGNTYTGKEVIVLLLDRQGDEITITEEVVKLAAGNVYSKRVIELLLDCRGDEITITEEVVKAAAGNEDNSGEVMALLLDRRGYEITITEEVIKAAAGNTNGKRVMELLLDCRGDEITITEEVVKAAAGNEDNSGEVMALLLDRRGYEITITEEVVKLAAGNIYSNRVMELLLDCRGDEITITEEVIKAAAGNRKGRRVIELLLDCRGDEITITEEVIKAAAGNTNGERVIELLLDCRGDEITITEEVIKAAAGNTNGKRVMELLLDRQGYEITITEEVVKAAAGNKCSGEKLMALLLDRRGYEITITEEVIKAAAGNTNGKRVMELLLDRQGYEITITEEVVKAAAGNKCSGEEIMALLLGH